MKLLATVGHSVSSTTLGRQREGLQYPQCTTKMTAKCIMGWSYAHRSSHQPLGLAVLSDPFCRNRMKWLVLDVNLPQPWITWEESLNEKFSSQVGLCACLWGFVLVVNWYGKTQPTVGSTVLQAGVLNHVRHDKVKCKQADSPSVFVYLWPWQ